MRMEDDVVPLGRAWGGAGALLGGLTPEPHEEETCATGAALPVLLWGF